MLPVEETHDRDADDAFAQTRSAEEGGDHSTAESLYRRVLKLDPNDPAAGPNLGNLLRGQSRMVEAEAAYRWVVKVDPNFSPAWHNLADRAKRALKYCQMELANAASKNPAAEATGQA